MFRFYKDRVFCFKPIEEREIDDGPEIVKDEKTDFPKSMKAVSTLTCQKSDLPEIFANINSNQSYNRGTIAKLKKDEQRIANYLINRELKINNPQIALKKSCFFNFLSPIEFETLIFLIFNYESSLCSSYRGGTLEDFDLKVSLKEFKGLPEKISYDSIQWIQVKKKMELKQKEIEYQEKHKDRILIYLGEKSDDQNRILGKDWLTGIIDKRPQIQRWLKEMTFRHKMFDFSFYHPIPTINHCICAEPMNRFHNEE
jgi:hypothetical protein